MLLFLNDVVCMLESSVDNVDTAKELLELVGITGINEVLRLAAELVGVIGLLRSDSFENFMTPGMLGVSGGVKELVMTRVPG